MSLSHDDRLLQRHLDGELSPEDAAAFATRLLGEEALRERVQAAEALRKGFQMAAAAPAPRASSSLRDKIMAEVRRQPDRETLRRLDLGEQALRICRRVLLAAAVLLALGAAALGGLFDGGRDGMLEAAPGEVQQEIDRLDALILEELRGGGEGGGGAETGVPRRGK